MNPAAVLFAACLGAMALAAPPVRAGDVPGVNDPPSIALVSPAPDTTPQVPVGVPGVVSDPDVGAGLMEMEINVSTTPSGLPVAQIGTFSWSFGTNVTSDVAVANRDQINAETGVRVQFSDAKTRRNRTGNPASG